jgi:endonuclease/exonuclease/phosphatase family metal-dependent hydrolase
MTIAEFGTRGTCYHPAVRIRLLTYNIHKAIGVDRRFDPDRIVQVLRHHDADIVLLQEVDRGVPRSQHADLASYFARQLDYAHRAVGMNVHLRKGRYGNATLSRFPIGRQQNIDLTVGRRKRRGAQHTAVHVLTPAGRSFAVDVYNVHLGLSAMERRRQVRKLLGQHALHDADARRPCIIAGDMNDWRGVLKRVFRRGGSFACATTRRPGSRWSIRTFPSYAPAGGLDKVFYRGPLRLLHAHRSRLNVARIASDHLPVIVEFEFVTR